TYRAQGDVDVRIAEVTAAPPEFDFTTADEVTHQLWVIPERSTSWFVQRFRKIPLLYVADGHHRCASASRARAALREKDPGLSPDHPVNWFPATLFPDRELAILPYNRIVKDLGGKTTGDFLESVKSSFLIRRDARAVPEK